MNLDAGRILQALEAGLGEATAVELRRLLHDFEQPDRATTDDVDRPSHGTVQPP